MQYSEFVVEHDRMWKEGGPIRTARKREDEWGSRSADHEWDAYTKTAKRCYCISERAVVIIDPQGSPSYPVIAQVCWRTPDGHFAYNPMLHNLTPEEWRAAAGVLALANDWVKGNIDELPPSDAERPK